MRSCEPATPSMRLLRPRMHPREVIQNRDGQRKPRRKVCFLFDALMQSKDWSETRNIWLRCEEPLTTRITPPTLTLALLNDRNTIVHGSHCSYPSHFCCPLQGDHDARDVSTSVFPSTSEGFAAISPPTLMKTSHSTYVSLLKFSPLSTCHRSPQLPFHRGTR
jgi:hypothetical protein